MVIQRAPWVQQQAMKESGTLIRIDLDFKNAFNSAGHSCLWAILRGLGVPDVDFLEDLYSKSWMKITVGTGCSAPIQLDTGTVQGSVLFPLLFDLFLNALLQRKRDACPDILNSQIQALRAMDEAFDADNTAKPSTKGQEAWRINLVTMYRQCPICNKKKGNCHFPTQLHLNPPCLECKHAWKPSGIKYNGMALNVIHGKVEIGVLSCIFLYFCGC